MCVCVCVCVCVRACMHAQLYPTLRGPKGYSPAGSSAHGILQARTLEWAATSSSGRSFIPRDPTHVSCAPGGFFSAAPPGKPWGDMVSSKFSVQEEIIYKLISEHSVPYMMLVSGPPSFVGSWPEEAWTLVLSCRLSSSVHARWGSNSEGVVAVWKSCARLLVANSLQPHGL